MAERRHVEAARGREKLEIARHLESLGVDIIEAGFPAASPGDFEAVRAVSQNVNCSVAALCRCVPDDIHKGWEAVKYSKNPQLHVFLATSDIHMKYKLRMEPDEVLRRAVAERQTARAMSTKVGRNEPCPCGSGKKYKHCCGKDA